MTYLVRKSNPHGYNQWTARHGEGAEVDTPLGRGWVQDSAPSRDGPVYTISYGDGSVSVLEHKDLKKIKKDDQISFAGSLRRLGGLSV